MMKVEISRDNDGEIGELEGSKNVHCRIIGVVVYIDDKCRPVLERNL